MTKASVKSKENWRLRIGYVGWGVVIAISLLLFLLPPNFAPSGLSSEVWLLVMVAILLFSLLGLLLGMGLLLIRYWPFGKQIQGILLFFALFVIVFRAFTFLQTVTQPGWLVSHLFVLFGTWLFALVGAMVLSLTVYFWFQDYSMRVLAVTFLIVIWSLVLYTRWRGAEQIVQDVYRGVLPAELMSVICYRQLVLLLAPLFFVGHSCCLLYREWVRADMQLVSQPLSTPALEKSDEQLI